MPIKRCKTRRGGEVRFTWSFDAATVHEESQHLPWLLSERDVEQQDSLCQLCRQLDIHYMFTTILDGRQIFEIGGEEMKMEQDGIFHHRLNDLRLFARTCIFCGFIWDLLCSMRGQDRMEQILNSHEVGQLRMASSMCGLHGLTSGPSAEQDAGTAYRVAFEISLYGYSGQTIFPIYLGLDDTGFGLSRSIGDRTDVNLLQEWLTRCDRSHGGHSGKPCPSSHNRQHIEARFIDVRVNCVVRKPTSVKYAALSYIWGKSTCILLTSSNTSQLETQHGLVPNMYLIPLTIKDAMTLCVKLDIQYLWVDGLCIQQDTGKKLEQIRGMHNIYSNAYVTLVAGAGADADYGLPGVTPRKAFQATCMIRDMRMTNLLHVPKDTIEISPWNTRGWTYQERILSERLLMFTDEEILFECRHGKIRESLRMDVHDYSDLVSCVERQTDTYSVDTFERTDFETYAKMVSEYSSRQLTSNDDIIYALQGLINVIKFSFTEPSFHFGLPVHLLDVALLWRPISRLRRRKGWPSWSWTGWIGTIEYFELIDIAERTRSCIKPVQGCLQRERADTDEINAGSKWTRCYSWEDGIYYCPKTGSDDRWHCRPKQDHDFHLLIRPRDRSLRVRAKVATMILGPPETASNSLLLHRNLSSIKQQKPDSQSHTEDELAVLSIMSTTSVNTPTSHRAGAIILDTNTCKSIKVGKPYRLVCLSRTTLSFGDNDPSWNDELQAYSGVPSEPAINRQDDTPLNAMLPPQARPAFESQTLYNDWFDSAVYDHNVCWCMYNVLLITDEDGTGCGSERLGIGKVHVHAFDEAAVDDMTLELR